MHLWNDTPRYNQLQPFITGISGHNCRICMDMWKNHTWDASNLGGLVETDAWDAVIAIINHRYLAENLEPAYLCLPTELS